MALSVLVTENEQNWPPACVGMLVGANVGIVSKGRGDGTAVGRGDGTAVGLDLATLTANAAAQALAPSHPSSIS